MPQLVCLHMDRVTLLHCSVVSCLWECCLLQTRKPDVLLLPVSLNSWVQDAFWHTFCLSHVPRADFGVSSKKKKKLGQNIWVNILQDELRSAVWHKALMHMPILINIKNGKCFSRLTKSGRLASLPWHVFEGHLCFLLSDTSKVAVKRCTLKKNWQIFLGITVAPWLWSVYILEGIRSWFKGPSRFSSYYSDFAVRTCFQFSRHHRWPT